MKFQGYINVHEWLGGFVIQAIETKTVLKRPVRFGSYRAFGPNARRSRLALVSDTATDTHNLIWKPQLRVLRQW